MKRRVWRAGTAICICSVVGILALDAAQAAPRAGRAVATRITGSAEYKSFNQKNWRPIKVGMALSEGLVVRTGAGSSADFALTTGAIVRLNSNSQARLEKLSEESRGIPGGDKASPASQRTQITLEQGQIINNVRKLSSSSSYTVLTPIGPVDVTGTTFAVWRDGNRFTIRATVGTVTLKVGGKLITLAEGQEIAFDYDPPTGQVRNANVQPTTAPTDDLLAQQIQDFKTDTKALEGVVLVEGAVDIDQLLQLLPGVAAAGEGDPLPGTPQLILVGNPSSTTSPSAP